MAHLEIVFRKPVIEQLQKVLSKYKGAPLLPSTKSAATHDAQTVIDNLYQENKMIIEVVVKD